MKLDRYYILYNSKAGNGKAEEVAKQLNTIYSNMIVDTVDLTKITNYDAFFSDKQGSSIIICGGDGTLNGFINNVDRLEIFNDIYFYPAGTGNDFLRDISSEEINGPVCITKYLADLPECEINGKSYKFINGIGYGIDGYCCEMGDILKAQNKSNINYTAIAIKGLLYDYKPTGATITVDGKTYKYKKVWLAPTMNGRYYGGGMMPTPDQDRLNKEREVSLFVFHDSGKIKTLTIFPSIFTGKHLKHTKVTKVFVGKDITVEFDTPTALQVDGETFLGIKKYRVISNKSAKKEENRAYASAE